MREPGVFSSFAPKKCPQIAPIFTEDGYPLHSGSHNRLWFGWENKMRKREGLLALIAIAVTGLAISFYVVCVVVGIADVQAAKRGCVFRGIIREVASVVTKLSPMGIGELILVNDASDHVCPFAERVREIISVFGCDGQGLPRENYLPPMLLRDIFERRNLLGWLQAAKGKNEVATRLNFFIQAGRRI